MGDVGVIEVFSSIQGEGLFVGCRQVFVRLAGCNLSCRYCDTTESFLAPPYCRLEQTAGHADFISIPSPMSVNTLLEATNRLLTVPSHSVSITGGEPLCQMTAVRDLSRNLVVPVFLETNGTLPEELEDVIEYIDIISMDIKLPSACGGRSYWTEHARFLSIASTKTVFVKIVLTPEMGDGEFFRAIDLIAAANPTIPTILQPATGRDGRCQVDPFTSLDRQAFALSLLSDVRVIPQTHKMLGQL